VRAVRVSWIECGQQVRRFTEPPAFGEERMLMSCGVKRSSAGRVSTWASTTMTVAAVLSLSSALFATDGRALAAQTPPTPTRPDQRGAHESTAGDQRYRYRFLGVYDEMSGEPMEGVEVSDVISGLKSTTTATGTVSLIFLPDGGSLVRLRKPGYEPQTLTISIAPADTAPVTLMMRKAVTLPTVFVKDSASKYVSPMLRGAEERMKSHAGGYFIDGAELRKHDESTMANVIIGRTPGLTYADGAHGEVYLLSSRVPCVHAFIKGQCGNGNCFVTVYEDGVKTFDPTATQGRVPPDFSRMSVMNYGFVEYYPGGASAPVDFGGLNAGCGVLLLWTREK
jgi:hypothetical protein